MSGRADDTPLVEQADAAREAYARTNDIADADRAVSLWEVVVAGDRNVDHVNELALAHRDRYDASGDPADLRRARELHAETVRAERDADFLNNLGDCLRECHVDLRDTAALVEAAEVLEEAVRAAPTNPLYVDNLALVLREQFRHTGDQADLMRAVDLHLQATSAAPAEHPDRPRLHYNLGGVLQELFDETDEPELLVSARAALELAVDTTAVSSPEYGARLAGLADCWLRLHENSLTGPDLDRVAEVSREAVALGPDSAVDMTRRLRVHADVLSLRYERTGSMADIEEALECCRRGERSTVASAHRTSLANNFAVAYQRRYERQGRPSDLDAAVETAQRAADEAHDDVLLKPLCLATLGAVLISRFDFAGDVTDLDQAIESVQGSLDLTPPTSVARVRRLRLLGAALAHRWHHLGDLGDLDRALVVFEAATAAGSILLTGERRHVLRAAMSTNDLGVIRRDRYEHTGDPVDLEASVQLFREALALQLEDSPGRVLSRLNLVEALRLRYERTAVTEDLDEAFALLSSDASSTDEDIDLGRRSANLQALLLNARFRRDGDFADLDEALRMHQRAVGETPDHAPARPALFNNWGDSLRIRYESTGSLDDLESATTVFRLALASTSETAPSRCIYLDNLANCLIDRYRAEDDDTQLDLAVETYAAALASQRIRAAEHARIGANLAGALWYRWNERHDDEDLDEVISLLDRALAVRPVSATMCRNTLAVALTSRHARRGTAADLDRATAEFRAACESQGDPLWALHAARNWGRWAMSRAAWSDAGEAHRNARQAARSLLATQLTSRHKENLLAQSENLAVDSALTALRLGDLPGAVCALEEGRALLLSERIAEETVDLGGLAAAGRSDLALRYRRHRGRLAVLARPRP